jgi:hypothetical protein
MGAFALAAMTALTTPQARAANIITFDNNANSCGGSVICSTNGTTGYLNNGTGQAFDLSTINSWFQIDVDGVNHLTATQTQAEPDGGAGAFLVKNDAGSTVTTFSLTLTDTFNSSTSSVTFCSGSSGPECDNFQANKGSAAPSGASEALSGPDFFSCTNGSAMNGFPCDSTAGEAAANFMPNSVTYTWSGLNILAGTSFDITFASWQGPQNANDVFPTPVSTPEPGSLALLGFGLAAYGFVRRRR